MGRITIAAICLQNSLHKTSLLLQGNRCGVAGNNHSCYITCRNGKCGYGLLWRINYTPVLSGYDKHHFYAGLSVGWRF